jgi:hypothetical protein
MDLVMQLKYCKFVDVIWDTSILVWAMNCAYTGIWKSITVKTCIVYTPGNRCHWIFFHLTGIINGLFGFTSSPACDVVLKMTVVGKQGYSIT